MKFSLYSPEVITVKGLLYMLILNALSFFSIPWKTLEISLFGVVDLALMRSPLIKRILLILSLFDSSAIIEILLKGLSGFFIDSET